MLTPMQARALVLIDARLRAEDVAPTRGELMAALGLRSRSGAQRAVDALVKCGYLRRLPRAARALEVVRRPGGGALPDPFEGALAAALALDEAQALALARLLVARAAQARSVPDLVALRDATAAALVRLTRPVEDAR